MNQGEANAENIDGDPQSIWYIVPVGSLHKRIRWRKEVIAIYLN